MKITNSEWLKEVGCFLFDMDGTIYLGDRLLPGAAQAIEFLQRQRMSFYFLTHRLSGRSTRKPAYLWNDW